MREEGEIKEEMEERKEHDETLWRHKSRV